MTSCPSNLKMPASPLSGLTLFQFDPRNYSIKASCQINSSCLPTGTTGPKCVYSSGREINKATDRSESNRRQRQARGGNRLSTAHTCWGGGWQHTSGFRRFQPVCWLCLWAVFNHVTFLSCDGSKVSPCVRVRCWYTGNMPWSCHRGVQHRSWRTKRLGFTLSFNIWLE